MDENDASFKNSNPTDHKEEQQRVEERDIKRTQYLADELQKKKLTIKTHRKSTSESYDAKTLSELINKRQLLMHQSNMKKFANFAKGVHGMELPKFSKHDADSQKYWQFVNGYVDKPNEQSQRVLLQTQKIWAKNDEMFINDKYTTHNPGEPFRKEHIP